ncbi:MAG: hypothetical protein AAB407_03475 [Patescibacteria group bacterium]
MKRIPLLIFFLAMVVCGIGVHIAIQKGWYPVAIVNGKLVGASRFEQTSTSIFHYYTQAGQFFGASEEDVNKVNRHEVRRVTLDKLVENELLLNKFQEIKKADFDERVMDRIATLEQENPDLENAVQELYGVPLNQFKTFVLIPQAREEIVAGEAFETQDAYLAWLAETRKNAKIYILDPVLTWNGEQIVFRK